MLSNKSETTLDQVSQEHRKHGVICDHVKEEPPEDVNQDHLEVQIAIEKLFKTRVRRVGISQQDEWVSNF